MEACFLLKTKKERDECRQAKRASANADVEIAKAVGSLAKQQPDKQMSPLAIVGIIGGGLLAITLMVVIIRKTRK